MLSIVVAKAKNNIIGKDNKLIWNLPEDMKRFKSLTTDKTMIMGRKTYESLGEILENRNYVVFSRNPDFTTRHDNVKVVHSMLEIQEYIEKSEETFVIGGAMIYNIMMPYVNKMYVTDIDKEFEGDAFFPRIDETVWTEVSREKGVKDEENNFDYDFIVYERK